MNRVVVNVLSIIITSMYLFPFELVYFPGINSKMALAIIGLVLLGKSMALEGNAKMNKDFFYLSCWAIVISLISFVTMTINETKDASFLTYFMSMWVWMGGAYAVIRWLKRVYGYVSVRLVCDYLIAVCVVQCIIAFILDAYPSLRMVVDSIIGGEAFMGKTEGRLAGIGAALDVAGLRFAAVAVIISYLLVHQELEKRKYIFYIFSFSILAVVGNMISRTTTMGIGLGLVYWCYSSMLHSQSPEIRKLWLWLGGIMCFILPLIVYLYNTDNAFHQNIRFAFEGFFSLCETGKWEVSSNNILFDYMIVFPETLRTWIIGDGYAANPISGPYADPYYIGPDVHGYYMGTDIGYLRYIFYFGVTGTLVFIGFMLKAALICINRFKGYKMMFLMILLVNYIGWFKVSTDIFLVFAIFLCISLEEEEEAEEYRLSESKIGMV